MTFSTDISICRAASSGRNLRMAVCIVVMLSAVSAFAAPPSAAREKEQLIQQRDEYAYAMCYAEDALDYAIANLSSSDAEARKFATDIAWEMVRLPHRRLDPSKMLDLLAAFAKTDLGHYQKFEVAFDQARRGSKAGLQVLAEEFKAKKLNYDSRQHVLEFLLINDVRRCESLCVAVSWRLNDGYEVADLAANWRLSFRLETDMRDYESLFLAGLDDRYEVAAFAAVGLHRIGNDKGKQWLIERISTQPPRTWPEPRILAAILDTKLKEAVPLLKKWLVFERSDELEFETITERTRVALTLAMIGDQEGQQFLRKILVPPRPKVRGVAGKAALCLARLGDRTSIRAMTEALKTARGREWVDLAESLLILEGPDVVQDLMQKIREDSSWSRDAADLAIKYRVRRALPPLQERFDKKNDKSEFARMVQQDPKTVFFLEYTGESEQQYIDGLYMGFFHECVSIALGFLDMQPEQGKENVLMLLRRDDFYIINDSLQRLFDGLVEHNITEAVPYLIPRLDSPDPHRRSFILDYLRELTGENLPPISEVWRDVMQTKNK